MAAKELAKQLDQAKRLDWDLRRIGNRAYQDENGPLETAAADRRCTLQLAMLSLVERKRCAALKVGPLNPKSPAELLPIRRCRRVVEHGGECDYDETSGLAWEPVD